MVGVRFDVLPHEAGRVLQLSQARAHFGRPVYLVSAYWVDDVLIDAGPSHTRAPFLRWAHEQRIDELWITHHHEDHVGNVGPLQAAIEVRAFASGFALRRAASHERIPWYRRHTWGEPDVGQLVEAPRSLSTRRHRFDVVPMPGHTPGDVAYVEPAEGWAFVGDAFLGVRQVITRPKEDLAATIASLERLLALRPRVLFTGMRVFPDAARVLEDRLAFLRATRDALAAATAEGGSPRQVRRRVLGRETFLYYWSGGDFGKQWFADQLLATPVPSKP